MQNAVNCIWVLHISSWMTAIGNEARGGYHYPMNCREPAGGRVSTTLWKLGIRHSIAVVVSSWPWRTKNKSGCCPWAKLPNKLPNFPLRMGMLRVYSKHLKIMQTSVWHGTTGIIYHLVNWSGFSASSFHFQKEWRRSLTWKAWTTCTLVQTGLEGANHSCSLWRASCSNEGRLVMDN